MPNAAPVFKKPPKAVNPEPAVIGLPEISLASPNALRIPWLSPVT